MNKLSSLVLGAAVALTTIGLAHAATPVTGAWKLSTGVADAPCVITLTSDTATAGTIASTGDCNGTTVTRWIATDSNLQLLSNNGTLVAYLKAKGDDTYVGTRVADGRKVALNR